MPETSYIPNWLKWARKLEALAQSGLAYSPNPYDVERFEQVKTIAAEMISAGFDLESDAVKSVFDSQAGYTTPKLDSRGVIIQGDQILLVKELADGGWTLPGGWMDVGESPSLAVEREVREEAGYIVRAQRLLAIYDRDLHGHPPFPFHIYKLFFQCEILGGEAGVSLETGGARFFPSNAYPRLSLSRVTTEELDRMFFLVNHPDLPTDFD